MTTPAIRRPPSRRRNRRGFTLAELMVTVVMLAIVGGALMNMLVRQQRFYRGTGDLMDLRSQLRQASQAITADLRGISTVGGDLVAMSDSSIDFRQTFGGSVVCKITTAAGVSTIVIPPKTLSSGALLTEWLSTPTTGDSIFVFDEGATTANTDDSWKPFGMSSVTAALNTCPTGSGNFTTVSDAARNSYTIVLSGALLSTATVGAPVRFYHIAHYSLYKASDNNWYLGFCSPACSGSNPITPVAGPFRPYSSDTTQTGFLLRFYDGNGNVTATKNSVTRIKILVRGATRNPVNISGFKSATVYDSLVTNVAIRNRT